MRWGRLHILSRCLPGVHQHKCKFPAAVACQRTWSPPPYTQPACATTASVNAQNQVTWCGKQLDPSVSHLQLTLRSSINESGAVVSISPDWLQQDKNRSVNMLLSFFVFVVTLLLTKTLIKLQRCTFAQPKQCTLFRANIKCTFYSISVLFVLTIHSGLKMLLVIWAVGCWRRRKKKGSALQEKNRDESADYWLCSFPWLTEKTQSTCNLFLASFKALVTGLQRL